MLVKILKIFSSVSLIAILFMMVTQRELTLFVKDTLLERIIVPEFVGKEAAKLKATSEQIAKMPTLEAKDTIHTAIVSKVNTQQATQPKQATAQTKNTIYEHLEVGTSDTDPSYSPSLSPCTKTMGYKLGVFDTQFGLSKEAFLGKINSAVAVWNAAAGKELFRYDENGPLTVNLIYDERQAKTVDIGYLALEISNVKKNAENVRLSYEKEKTIYIADSAQLTEDANVFQEKYKIYEEKVAMYNAQGGAQKDEYDAMTRELEQLKIEGKALDERRLTLLSLMDSINKKVTRYNDLVVYVNSLIRKSNALGAGKFTEGKFTPSSNTIDIYQYSDNTKLLRVLIHEIGHAIGINHNDNVYSIMYSVNSATTTTLSKEDIDDLTATCLSQ